MKIIQKNYEGDMNGKDMARDKNKQISIAKTVVAENFRVWFISAVYASQTYLFPKHIEYKLHACGL